MKKVYSVCVYENREIEKKNGNIFKKQVSASCKRLRFSAESMVSHLERNLLPIFLLFFFRTNQRERKTKFLDTDNFCLARLWTFLVLTCSAIKSNCSSCWKFLKLDQKKKTFSTNKSPHKKNSDACPQSTIYWTNKKEYRKILNQWMRHKA